MEIVGTSKNSKIQIIRIVGHHLVKKRKMEPSVKDKLLVMVSVKTVFVNVLRFRIVKHMIPGAIVQLAKMRHNNSLKWVLIKVLLLITGTIAVKKLSDVKNITLNVDA